jgi:hypothetical protein
MRAKLPLVPERTVDIPGGSQFTHLSVLDMAVRQLHLSHNAHFIPRKGSRYFTMCAACLEHDKQRRYVARVLHVQPRLQEP